MLRCSVSRSLWVKTSWCFGSMPFVISKRNMLSCNAGGTSGSCEPVPKPVGSSPACRFRSPMPAQMKS